MKKLSILFLSGAMIASSCGKFVDGYEISPNDPTEVPNSLLLTVTEVSTFSHYTGQLARLSAVLMQHQAGTESQFEEIADYNLLSGDNVNEWESIYSNGLMNAQTLIDQAGDANPYYRGIARIMKAMNLGIATDYWGDIPNSGALQGLNETPDFEPVYDAQESVIADIQQLLNDAVTDLSKTAEENTELPSDADDVIFAGDANSWIITAHILKARYANRLSKRDASGSATNALACIDDAVAAGLSSVANDCNAYFGTNGNELNQWYAFQNSRGGYMQMGANLVDLLTTINDPRLSFYAAPDVNGDYTGTTLGTNDISTSTIGTYFASANSPLPLVTYVEAKFIEAEAAFRSGDLTRAASAHNEGIVAHITLVTGAAPDATYIADQASEDNSTITLEKIMTHKYVAMYTQPEIWSDWRRTGLPTLTANPTAQITEIPRRLLTPQSELDYNSNAPQFTSVGQLTDPIWWDQ